MAVATGGFVQAISNGWNTLTLNVSKTCSAGWQKLKEFGPVQKTVDFAAPYYNTYYPDAFKFTWSTGTAMVTGMGALTMAKIIQLRDTELKQVKRQIATLENKQKGLKENSKDLHTTEQGLLDALIARRDELSPPKKP